MLVVNQALQLRGYVYTEIFREETKKYTESSEGKRLRTDLNIDLLRTSGHC